MIPFSYKGLSLVFLPKDRILSVIEPASKNNGTNTNSYSFRMPALVSTAESETKTINGHLRKENYFASDENKRERKQNEEKRDFYTSKFGGVTERCSSMETNCSILKSNTHPKCVGGDGGRRKNSLKYERLFENDQIVRKSFKGDFECHETRVNITKSLSVPQNGILTSSGLGSHQSKRLKVDGKCDHDAIAAGYDKSDKPFCVISDVVGNAKEAFDECSEETTVKTPVVITPKKTKDITKIKGWRRKQFLVEKSTTVEFYRYEKGSAKTKIRLEDFDKADEPENLENAFVSDSLNDFLDHDAELKINYEIPHLYAEVGIKLTSEDIVSKPKLTDEDVKKVGNKYCVDLLPVSNDVISLKSEDESDEMEMNASNSFEEMKHSYKIFKVDKNVRRFIKVEEKWEPLHKKMPKSVSILKTPLQRIYPLTIREEKMAGDSKPSVKVPPSQTKTLPPGMAFTSKLLGLVVYPSPFAPLHPIVQKHLHKLRSYRTKIDKNWANFAVSAVRAKWQNRYVRRKILPAYCPGKIKLKSKVSDIEHEVKQVVSFLVDSVCKNIQGDRGKDKIMKEEIVDATDNVQTKMVVQIVSPEEKDVIFETKKCRVVVTKIIPQKKFKIWCMEHECYSCHSCGFSKVEELDELNNSSSHSMPSASEALGSAGCLNISEIYATEPKASELSAELAKKNQPPALFDQKLTNLLAKKLRDVAMNEDILINLDKLKSFIPNDLELIKLNFLKQSFLAGSINLWYLKPTSKSICSRAFLTFSNVPPESNAININRVENLYVGLPKVIKEIVSAEAAFSDDEYAILHCNGKAWEIHGSLNVAFNKDEDIVQEKDVEAEQILIPIPLPELDQVRKTSAQILRVKATKWWILDLSQDFEEVVFNVSSMSTTTISRKHLLAVIRTKFLGFFLIKKRKGRFYGVYILENLFPFVLIGPYYTFEKCSLALRVESQQVPFAYKPIENLPRGNSLKVLINYAVSAMDPHKKLTGLWLHDKKKVDNACYLETLTMNTSTLSPKRNYSIEEEHGYALNNVRNGSHSDTLPIIVQSSVSSVSLDVTVYLFFDVFDLGYVIGQLQGDNSVGKLLTLLNQPSSPVPSVRTFPVSMLRKRIKFIPANFEPKWFVTRHKEDLQNRMPFNKYYLDGTHILCQRGIISIMKVTREKMTKFGLKKEEIMRAISECHVIHEVAALKHLKSLVNKDPVANPSMEQVLAMAVTTIERLKKEEGELELKKKEGEEKKLNLWKRYVMLISKRKGDDNERIKYLYNAVRRKHKQREVNYGVRKILEEHEFGRKFVEGLKVDKSNAEPTPLDTKALRTIENTCRKGNRSLQSKDCLSNSNRMPKAADKFMVKSLETKLLRMCQTLDRREKSLSVADYGQLLKKLNSISNQINVMKNMFREKLPVGDSTTSTTAAGAVAPYKGKGKNEDEENGESKKKMKGFLDVEPNLTGAMGEEKKNISMIGIKGEAHQGGKVLQTTSQMNESKGISGSDKKLIILKRGTNNGWSVRNMNII